MASAPEVLVLGCGHVGKAVAMSALAQGRRVLTTTRSHLRAEALEREGLDVQQTPALDQNIGRSVGAETHVVVSFPPDGTTDALIAPALAEAKAITYVSSTGVYGDHRGHLDDHTPLPPRPNERAARILRAEEAYRSFGATVLRCPGIYGPERGLHRRILRGEHRVPGDGSRWMSRIHVEDLAQMVMASAAVRGETFVVGDLEPAPHIEVVRFVCSAYGVPLPPSVPLEEVHESLRADRRIDPSRALQRLGVTLRYPSFRQGMAPSAGPSSTPT